MSLSNQQQEEIKVTQEILDNYIMLKYENRDVIASVNRELIMIVFNDIIVKTNEYDYDENGDPVCVGEIIEELYSEIITNHEFIQEYRQLIIDELLNK